MRLIDGVRAAICKNNGNEIAANPDLHTSSGMTCPLERAKFSG
jgi:hypothetical protein